MKAGADYGLRSLLLQHIITLSLDIVQYKNTENMDVLSKPLVSYTVL